LPESVSLRGSGAGQQAGEPRYDVLHVLDIVQRRWWLLATTLLVSVLVAWWFQHGRLPSYTAEVLLQQRQGEQISPFGFTVGGGIDFGSHLDLIRSDEVLRPVVDSLGLQLRLGPDEARRSRLVRSVKISHPVRPASYELVMRGDSLVLADEATGRVVSVAAAGQTLQGPGFGLELDALEVDYGDPVRMSVVNREVAIDQLHRRLKIEQGTGYDLIWVRYSAPDSRTAAAVANATANSYQRQRSTSARNLASRRRTVISDQMNDLVDSLRVAEGVVLDYLASSRVVNPEVEGGALLSSLITTENELRELRFQEGLLQTLVVGLNSPDRADESLQQLMSMGSELVPAGGQLTTRLQDLELQRSQLMASTFGRTASDPQVQVVESQIASTKTQMRVAAEQALALVRNRLQATQRAAGQLQGEVGTLPVRAAEYSRRQDRVLAIQDAFDGLVGKYFEAQIAEAVESGDIDVVSPAQVPIRPDPSRKLLQYLSTMFAGLLIGSLGALLMDQTDSSIRREHEAERASSLQVLAKIPSVSLRTRDPESLLLGKEAFRTLRTHLLFSSSGEPPRAIAVTSPTPRDGKSTVAANLALITMEQGWSVVLVDGDLRRPQLHTTYEIDLEPGLSDVLLGTAALEDALVADGDNPGLSLLPAGTDVTNPTELIGSNRFVEVVAELRKQFDMVVIDTPPLLAVTDAALTGALMDGTLVVVRANKTEFQSLEAGVAMLRRLRVPLLGIVMNDMRTSSSGYSYYPSYGQGRAVGDKQKRVVLRGRSPQRKTGSDGGA
jgi:succinoglycan biosynthesis transport protein ExoP